MASTTSLGLRAATPRRTNRKFGHSLLIALAYFIVYVAINSITDSHQFRGSGITLWSPDNGVSLILIMESPLFAPVVVVAAVLSDVFIHHVVHGFAIGFASELVLTMGYVVIALVLRDFFKFDVRTVSFSNVLVVLAVVPVSTSLTAALYCGVLYIAHALPADQFISAMYNFWIGDTVGMIVVVPAATAIYQIAATSSWRQILRWDSAAIIVVVGLGISFALFLGAGAVAHRHLFYLLFLPIIWVGVRYGYAAVAITLLATQCLLIALLTYFQVDDNRFGDFQTLMFILSVTGQLLGSVMTERAQATTLMRKQQAELSRISAQAATSAMAVTLAHEISQPLSSLATYVHSARRMVDSGQPTEAVLQALGRAESEAQRARMLMERIRDFVSTGKLDLEWVNLEDVAEKIRSLNREDAQTRGVRIDFEATGALPPVRADKIAIEQALNNLVINAVDAVQERNDALGSVTIRLSTHDDVAVIRVDDNGRGVASEVVDSLFEAFETTKRNGMGLGLPLTLQIARRHSGQLGWRPLKPQGASFFIELPIHGPDQDAA